MSIKYNWFFTPQIVFDKWEQIICTLLKLISLVWFTSSFLFGVWGIVLCAYSQFSSERKLKLIYPPSNQTKCKSNVTENTCYKMLIYHHFKICNLDFEFSWCRTDLNEIVQLEWWVEITGFWFELVQIVQIKTHTQNIDFKILSEWIDWQNVNKFYFLSFHFGKIYKFWHLI